MIPVLRRFKRSSQHLANACLVCSKLTSTQRGWATRPRRARCSTISLSLRKGNDPGGSAGLQTRLAALRAVGWVRLPFPSATVPFGAGSRALPHPGSGSSPSRYSTGLNSSPTYPRFATSRHAGPTAHAGCYCVLPARTHTLPINQHNSGDHQRGAQHKPDIHRVVQQYHTKRDTKQRRHERKH